MERQAQMIPLLQSKFIRQESNSFVGINLGNCYIKGLAVEGGKVEKYFIEKNSKLPETIRKLAADKKILKKKIKLSLKSPSCLVRYFTFPKMERKKLSQAIFYEMNKFIPFDPTEVYFDFFILKENNPREISILLAAAKKNFIDQIINTFSEAGLRISEISLDSICLNNLFLNNYEDAEKLNACILDIGYNFSTMTILNKGIPFLTRNFKFSAKDAFQVISRIKNISPAEVEKWISSLKSSKEFLKLISDSITGACKEIKSSFDYFEVNRGERVDKAYISGGLVAVKGFEEGFAENLEMDVEILEVLSKNEEKLSEPFEGKKFEAFKNSFSVAFGLIL